jgi:hypothetical protein
MQILALISIYAPVVITIIAVVAVVFSFFWVFIPNAALAGECDAAIDYRSRTTGL